MRLVETPEPLPDGSRLLHIGLPKTGTSALQAAIEAAREQLQRRGVRNVSPIRNPLKAAAYGAGNGTGEPGERRRWERLAHDFATSDARQTLLSSEALCAARPERVAALREELGPDLHVLVTLRPLASVLPSAWQQGVRQGSTLSYDAWLQRRVVPGPDGDFRVWRNDAGRLLAHWGETFGEDRLVFVIGDPADRTFNLRTVDRLLGTDLLELQPMLNASPSYPEVELLRHFNLVRADASDAAPDDVAWNKVLHQVGRHLGDHPRTAAASQPIATPRWAVEAANEHARRTITALEGSDALVVGDPSHLLVDPTGHPDAVPAPEPADLPTAAWFADLVVRTVLAERDAAHAKELARAASAPGAGEPLRSAGLDEVGGRDLARALVRRARRRLSGTSSRFG